MEIIAKGSALKSTSLHSLRVIYVLRVQKPSFGRPDQLRDWI